MLIRFASPRRLLIKLCDTLSLSLSREYNLKFIIHERQTQTQEQIVNRLNGARVTSARPNRRQARLSCKLQALAMNR